MPDTETPSHDCPELAAALDRNTAAVDRMSDTLDHYLERQSNSLSMDVLQKVLVPITMKLFTFFSIIVLILIGGISALKQSLPSLIPPSLPISEARSAEPPHIDRAP